MSKNSDSLLGVTTATIFFVGVSSDLFLESPYNFTERRDLCELIQVWLQSECT